MHDHCAGRGLPAGRIPVGTAQAQKRRGDSILMEELNVDIGPLAAIMAQQRSGTHMLGSFIGSHPEMKYTGEIFCRNVPQTVAQMDRTLGRIVCGGFKVIVLDVKYNQISPPVEELLNWIPVIHLIRKDTRRLYFSGELHSYYGAHPEAREQGVIPKFKFDRARYQAIVRARQEAIQRFSRLEDMRLVYEDLTNDQQITELPEWAGRQICHVLGVEYHPLTTDYTKNAPADIEPYLTGK
jgi:hypothetical protein